MKKSTINTFLYRKYVFIDNSNMQLVLFMRKWEWEFLKKMESYGIIDVMLLRKWKDFPYAPENLKNHFISFLNQRNHSPETLYMDVVELNDLVYEFFRITAYRYNIPVDVLVHFFVYMSIIHPDNPPSIQILAA